MAKRYRRKPGLPDLPPGWTSWDGLERAEVSTGAALSATGDVVETRATVWRVKTPRAFAALTIPQRMAMVEYAATVEAVWSSGGTSDPTGGGGSAPGSRPPSLHRLEAASRLRAMDAALADHRLEITMTAERPVVVPFVTLARWIAVDELTRPEILRRLGFDPERSTGGASGRLAIATRDVADVLAGVCGFGSSDPARHSDNARNG